MLQKEKLDFIQVNYSLAERSVEDKLLAVAADTGTALMCNLPFARAVLFKAVAGKQVSEWAKEFDAPSWVLNEACREVKALLDEGFAVGRVAVNLSARQFRDQRLIERIQEILVRNKLDARYLELEITESLLIRDVETVVEKLHVLKSLGLSLSLDDFGTGYSSLSYLKRFPIDRIKIDQSFTRDIGSADDSAEITNGIISLGHSLGLSVIAEGVETESQLNFLRRGGCDEIQGYFYSRPVDALQLRALLPRG